MGTKNKDYRLAKLHQRIANCPLDTTLHRVSYSLVKDNGILLVEDLDMKGLMKKQEAAKDIAYVSWGTFVGLLAYKSHGYDRELARIDQVYPSRSTDLNKTSFSQAKARKSRSPFVLASEFTIPFSGVNSSLLPLCISKRSVLSKTCIFPLGYILDPFLYIAA